MVLHTTLYCTGPGKLSNLCNLGFKLNSVRFSHTDFLSIFFVSLQLTAFISHRVGQNWEEKEESEINCQL